jgi:hypothetical protein
MGAPAMNEVCSSFGHHHDLESKQFRIFSVNQNDETVGGAFGVLKRKQRRVDLNLKTCASVMYLNAGYNILALVNYTFCSCSCQVCGDGGELTKLSLGVPSVHPLHSQAAPYTAPRISSTCSHHQALSNATRMEAAGGLLLLGRAVPT